MMIQCIIHLQFTRQKIHLLTRCRSHFLMNMWSIKTLGHIETCNLVFHLIHQKWPKWLRFSGSSNPTSTMLEEARYNYPCRYRKMTITKLDTPVKANKITNPCLTLLENVTYHWLWLSACSYRYGETTTVKS